ncbi:zinc finger protein, putative [Bodo saltans]|uniref:Zinc finger protein, putative n=1 Tax=Bodo saltans TaxID=75058 RepID=A0A0S4ILL5_BODSA|nr:zinc finger protein, putative [Bodo saltans]|eukprot:CUF27546.1 zinc finger protein, putative [Bodo saltans]
MQLPETFVCCVCLEAMVHAVSLMPCHDTICAACARTIMKKMSSRRCPLCRKSIKTVVFDETFSNVVRTFLECIGKWIFQQQQRQQQRHVDARSQKGHAGKHKRTSQEQTVVVCDQKQSLVEGLVKAHQELAAQCCLSEDALRALITLEWNERGCHGKALADRLRVLSSLSSAKAQPLATTRAIPLDESDPGKRYAGRLSTWNGIYGRICGEAFQSQFDFMISKSEILFVCSDLHVNFSDEESVCSAVVSFRVERVSNMGPREWRAYDAVFLGPDTAVGLYARRKDNDSDDDDSNDGPRALIENAVVDPTLPGMYHVRSTGIRLEGDHSSTSGCLSLFEPREVVFRLFTSKQAGDGGIVGEPLRWLEPRWKIQIPALKIAHPQSCVREDSDDNFREDSNDDESVEDDSDEESDE